MNEQEDFWANYIAQDYMQANSSFNVPLGIEAWEKMTSSIDLSSLSSLLECGCNIGRNLNSLKNLIPKAHTAVIEINKEALEVAVKNYEIAEFFHGSIKDAKLSRQFNLVFTCGVLIHINPLDLLDTMQNIYNLSDRYILIAEYFNRTPVSIVYRGQSEKLFKRDFGKEFMENFDVRLVDYGFLWGHIYDDAGFDDVTYWLFEKP
jgi:pseudaminic acid biosynthesis-associated methylase